MLVTSCSLLLPGRLTRAGRDDGNLFLPSSLFCRATHILCNLYSCLDDLSWPVAPMALAP